MGIIRPVAIGAALGAGASAALAAACPDLEVSASSRRGSMPVPREPVLLMLAGVAATVTAAAGYVERERIYGDYDWGPGRRYPGFAGFAAAAAAASILTTFMPAST